MKKIDLQLPILKMYKNNTKQCPRPIFFVKKKQIIIHWSFGTIKKKIKHLSTFLSQQPLTSTPYVVLFFVNLFKNRKVWTRKNF